MTTPSTLNEAQQALAAPSQAEQRELSDVWGTQMGEGCTLDDLDPPVILKPLPFPSAPWGKREPARTARMGLVSLEERRQVPREPEVPVAVIREALASAAILPGTVRLPLDPERLELIAEASLAALTPPQVAERLRRGMTIRTRAFIYRPAPPVRSVAA